MEPFATERNARHEFRSNLPRVSRAYTRCYRRATAIRSIFLRCRYTRESRARETFSIYVIPGFESIIFLKIFRACRLFHFDSFVGVARTKSTLQDVFERSLAGYRETARIHLRFARFLFTVHKGTRPSRWPF